MKANYASQAASQWLELRLQVIQAASQWLELKLQVSCIPDHIDSVFNCLAIFIIIKSP